MSLISKIIFFGFFLAVFLFEGLGLVDRQLALFSIYLMPFFLGLPLFFQYKPIYFPKKISWLFFLLFAFSFISLFFSVNVERSFYFLIFYLSVFLIFIYVYNFKKELVGGIIFFTFILSFIFLLDSLFLGSSLSKNWAFLIPKRDYQFVYQVYTTHHPLGIFLIIPLSFILIPLLEGGKKIYFFLFLFFFPALIFSYFRSSYFAFIITAGWLVFKKWSSGKLQFKKLIIFSLIIIFSGSILFSLTSYEKPIFLLSNINQFLQNNFHLNSKSFFSGRDEFWLASVTGFFQNPIFGIGLGNILNLTLRFTQSGALADSSNLFLDFFAETGIFGGLVFFSIFLAIFISGKNILSEKNMPMKMIYVAFFSLFIFFQFGPGLHYSLILFFFILGALIYREEGSYNLNGLFFSLALFIVIIFQSMMMSRLYFKSGQYLLSFYRFPFQKAVYRPLIEETGAEKYADIYARLFSGETDALNYLGQRYERIGETEKALSYYEKSYDWAPFKNLSLIHKIYRLKKNNIGFDF